MDHCHPVEENLGLIECFKSRLRKLISVEPLVDLLHFLGDEHKELLRAKLTTEGNQRAVDHLLETITRVHRPPGWFREFIDGLETVGCRLAAKYIVNSPPSPALEEENDRCVKLINLLQLSLEKMKTRDVCISCCSLDILTEEDRENIFAETEQYGNIRGARLLLRRVVRNEEGWFSTFLKALQDTGHPHLVREVLGEDLVDNEECNPDEKQTEDQGHARVTSLLYLCNMDDDLDEIDLYTDPSEQTEEASDHKVSTDAALKGDHAPVKKHPPVPAKETPPSRSPVLEASAPGPGPRSTTSSSSTTTTTTTTATAATASAPTPVAKQTLPQRSLSELLMVEDWERETESNPFHLDPYEYDLLNNGGGGGIGIYDAYDEDLWNAGDAGCPWDQWDDLTRPPSATLEDYDPY
ncbi:uncharacterized protein LOC134437597 [Engraulis encrasicolus]|uniref:uncharacterized protein LOC134437597 n=1 Tax=Engraulis encrasicolus TaxID=184585 RepID=UPI002FD25CFF